MKQPKTKLHDLKPKASKPKPKRRYNLINDEMRSRLISLIVDDKLNIVTAAERAGINYENAKAIYRIYRTQGRQNKKKSYLTQSKKLMMLHSQTLEDESPELND